MDYDDRMITLRVSPQCCWLPSRFQASITMDQYCQLKRAIFPGIRTEVRIILLLKSCRRGPLDRGVVPEVLYNKVSLKIRK